MNKQFEASAFLQFQQRRYGRHLQYKDPDDDIMSEYEFDFPGRLLK
jgi:hypothetical protein